MHSDVSLMTQRTPYAGNIFFKEDISVGIPSTTGSSMTGLVGLHGRRYASQWTVRALIDRTICLRARQVRQRLGPGELAGKGTVSFDY